MGIRISWVLHRRQEETPMRSGSNLELVERQWLEAGAHKELQTRETIASRIRQERARAERNGHGFSMVVFGTLSDRDQSKALAAVAKVLLERMRDTDEAGWLADQTLCAILPETKPHGAERLIADVKKQFTLPDDIEYRIYCYPSNWINGAAADPVRNRNDRHNGDGNGNGHSGGNGHNGNGHNGNGHNGNGHNGNGKHNGNGHSVVASASVESHPLSTGVAPLEPLLVARTPLWKRSVDVMCASIALILLSPVLFVVAILVKVSSPGPIIFRQRRAGPGNHPFTMYKFRTMVNGAEKMLANLQKFNERDGPAFKMKRDPRTTRIGRFLRKTSLDELPQLLNVLKGDMSLVGPRPLPCHEANACLPWQRRRMDVTPGITCTWQIQLRSKVTFTEWMRMDIGYARGRSFLNDLKILLKTIPAVVGCRSTS
jgi:lipopolysaccharide/colanic/teichoic acid biosynthesis glycosyltransferase